MRGSRERGRCGGDSGCVIEDGRGEGRGESKDPQVMLHCKEGVGRGGKAGWIDSEKERRERDGEVLQKVRPLERVLRGKPYISWPVVPRGIFLATAPETQPSVTPSRVGGSSSSTPLETNLSNTFLLRPFPSRLDQCPRHRVSVPFSSSSSSSSCYSCHYYCYFSLVTSKVQPRRECQTEHKLII